MIRLRQVALVAADRDSVVADLCAFLGVTVCFVDPGIAGFGLHNALMTIGDQFLEVVSPVQDGTTAGRLLDKRDGDGGYMAIFEVDDLDARIGTLDKLGVRLVWTIEQPDIRGRHLHPRDVGGALVSLDQPATPGAWPYAGPWTGHSETSVVTAIAGIDVAATDPAAMAARWSELGIDHAVRFVPAGPRGEGIDAMDVTATDRSRVGETATICGIELRLV
ncbi:MAG: VOC family protein [Ilumatobacteraceae bacterium]